MARPLNEIQREEARELFRQGKSTVEVMRHFGALSSGNIPSHEIETQTILEQFSPSSRNRSIFNTQAAQEVFTKAGEDVSLAKQAAQSGQQNPFFGTQTALIQGGLAIPRAIGEGFFTSEAAQPTIESGVSGLEKFGQAITPQPVKDVIGDVATQTIEGFTNMEPSEQLRQRNLLGVAEVLSYFLGGTAAKDAVVSPTIRAGERVVENVASEVGRVSENIPRMAKNVPEPIVGEVPTNVTNDIVKTFDTAIKPNLASKRTPAQVKQYNEAVAEAVQSISENVDNLRFFDDATGESISGQAPQDLKQFVDALEQTKQEIFKQYDDLAQQTGEAGAKVDIAKLADELESVINNRSLQVASPEAIRYAETVQSRLRQIGDLNASDAQEVIRQFNNSLDAFYRNPTPDGLTRQAVDALVANRLRVLLDEEVQAITGGAYQALKKQYGSLSTVERDILRAYNRDARRNVRGLIDFTDVFSGGQVVSGILSMNPALIGQGVAQKAISGAIKMVNDPNRQVRNMFKKAGQYRRPKDTANMPTRLRLEAPEAGAPRSEVSSGAPIQAGGQTAKGRVEAGITERAKEGAVKQPTQSGFFKAQAGRFTSPETYINAVRNNPAWLKKVIEAGLTPEEIAKLVFSGTAVYFLLANTDDDGIVLPAGLAMLAAMPSGTRAEVIEQAARSGKKIKIPDEVADDVLKSLNMEEPLTKVMNAGGDIDADDVARLELLQSTSKQKPLTDEELIEAKSIMEKYGDIFPEAELATTKTTDLLEEARKYDSAEEFRKAYTANSLMDLSDPQKHRWGRIFEDGVDEETGRYMDAKYTADLYGSRGNNEYKFQAEANVPDVKSPEEMVTIYRGTVSAQSEMMPGDFVSFSKEYALSHNNGEKLLTLKVPAKDVVWQGNDLNEWVYSPESIRGKTYNGGLTKIWEKATGKKADDPYTVFLRQNRDKYKTVEDWVNGMKASGKTRTQLEDIWKKANQKGSTNLLEEARKYDSASEKVKRMARGNARFNGFVNDLSGQRFYHGTADDFDTIDMSKVGSVHQTDWGKGFSLSAREADASQYKKRAVEGTDKEGIVKEFYVDPDAKSFDYKKKSPRDTNPTLGDELKEKGYDVLYIYDERDGITSQIEEVLVLNPDVLYTRTQLEDIWKQANE